MTSSADKIESFHEEFVLAMGNLHALMFRGITESQDPPNDHVRRFLTHGVGRRLSVLKQSIEGIFAIFPPDRNEPLTLEEAGQVQIYLHAFLINLAGVFDNWAWAFVYRHDLRDELRPLQIGIFKSETQRYLPVRMMECLDEYSIPAWHSEYAKEYRDALAHRISPYVASAMLTDEEQVLHSELGQERTRLIEEGDLDGEEEARNRQMQLGSPSPYFVHDINPDEPGTMVALHGQLLSDVLTVIEFGNAFYDSWGERAE